MDSWIYRVDLFPNGVISHRSQQGSGLHCSRRRLPVDSTQCSVSRRRGSPMPPPLFQLLVFQTVGSLAPTASIYTTTSPMAPSKPKNLFGMPSSYISSSSLGMPPPPEMMTGIWPQNQNTAGQIGFSQGALATPQRTLPLTMHQ